MTFLQLKQISKTYEKSVLNNINFNINKGECIALLGASGSGKSTLFNLIAGLEKADSGTILLNNQLIQIGDSAYMQQKDLLLPYRTVLDNIILPLQLAHIDDEKAIQKALDYLILFNLQDYAMHYPDQLSGGMRQRIAFIRTLLTNKDLILLDEPFSALDALTRKQLQMWFASMRKTYHLTTLLVTHDIDEALFLADKIAILKDGSLNIIKELPISKENYLKSIEFLNDRSDLLKQLLNEVE